MKFSDFRTRLITIISIIVFSIFIMLLDSVGGFSIFYDFTALISSPVRVEVRKVVVKINDYIGALKKISSLNEENNKLRNEREQLLEKLSGCEEMKAQNEALKDQLYLVEKGERWILEGRVIGIDTKFENILQINVGSAEGVEIGDVVVYGRYAIGVIEKVSTNFSRVKLITSKSINLPVMGEKNRAKGILNGNVGLTFDMKNILPDETIEEEEIIITSGVESPFPGGFIVGTVKSVNNDLTRATKTAIVESQINFAKLDYVYIIRGQNI